MNDFQDSEDNDDMDDVQDDAPDHAGVNVLPPFIFGGFFLLAVLLEIFMGADLFRWGAQLTIGILLISLGAGILTWSAHLFINAGTNLPPNTPTIVLVTEGPYKISRNPIYLAMTFIYVGLTVLFDVVWGWPLLIPLIYVIRKYVIDREEEYLARKFGSDYTEYCASVRRWL